MVTKNLNQPEQSTLHELLKLENQLCFSIYAASRAITKAYRPILEKFGLTYPQYLVMLTLWEYDGALVSDIGKRLYLDSGTLTPLLKRMEAGGIIERKRAKDDERKVEIHLTEKGLTMRSRALEIPLALIEGSHLDQEEVNETKALVDKILGRLIRSQPQDELDFYG